MRILFLSHDYAPERVSGVGAATRVSARALAGRGHDVHVLAHADGPRGSDARDGDVVVHRRVDVPFVSAVDHRGGGMCLTAAATAALHIGRLGPFDVVEAPDWAAPAAFLRHRCIVVTLHTPQIVARPIRASRLALALERASVRRASTIVSPSALLRDRLAALGWIPDRTETHVRCFPMPLAAPATAVEPGLVVAVGNLIWRKGFDVLARAAGPIGSRVPDARVVVVGSGNEVDRVRCEAGAADVVLIGATTHAEALEWIGRAAVVAIPSRFDNVPMVALEAMARGVPVVCTDSCGVVEVAGDGVHVVPVENHVVLADAVAGLLEDPAAAASLGARGRARVAGVLDPSDWAADREALYAGMVT